MNQEPVEVWIVDDDAGIRWVLERAMEQAGMACRGFDSAPPALEALENGRPRVLVTDIRMPGPDGLDLLARLQAEWPELPVIVITAHSDLDSAVAAYQGGAFEYLPKPFDIDQAVELVRRAAADRGGAGETGPAPTLPSLIGQAPAMQDVFRAIGRLSGSSMTVLITGESGTGKELVARALHQHSPRAARSFVALNTAAIPAELLESELFGHEKGAFTGAESRRTGRFEQADGGTLFLDEIGDMSAALQTRLLRVLAEGEFYRVGGQVPVRVDVRVIAATNQDLARGVKEGRFREDLYHRLNVMRIRIPPLRERQEDVPLLLEHYLRKAADELAVTPKTLAPEVLERLAAFDWPGNVRQLVNICRRLTVVAPGREIRLSDLPPELGAASAGESALSWQEALASWAAQRLDADGGPLLAAALPEFERALIRVAMARSGGHRQEAARLLGWGRNTLARKIRELGLDDL
ncbi:nitrogen regulation protein NR(I) [Thioalkalivibrio sp. XN279]|uniref:nitrogen regulation protein NR(I) n=1 Tax=Thioalkalivibrio sp. XN279 TaxID=2714953 RepID=UPI001407508C|nr:nitrogen regulation protein NR(I) [Thioalkalivibrio sp. XN279]